MQRFGSEAFVDKWNTVCAAASAIAMLVQAAIVARKQELAVEQQLLQAAVDAGVASGIDPLDQPDIPADIKASTNTSGGC